MNCAKCFETGKTIKLRYVKFVPCRTGDHEQWKCFQCGALFYFPAGNKQQLQPA